MNLKMAAVAATLMAGVIGTVAAAEMYDGYELNGKLPQFKLTLSKQPAKPVDVSKYALDGRTLYFVDKGYVYMKDVDSGRVSCVDGIEKVEEILVFKRSLVARTSSGDVAIRFLGAQEWVRIGVYTRRILATDTDLVALTGIFPDFRGADGELWVYKGRPSYWGVSFYDTGLRNIRQISPCLDSAGHRDIKIEFKNGETAFFSQIK